MTTASVTGAPLVAHLDDLDSTLEWPVAGQTGQQEADRCQTPPTSHAPVGGARTRPVSQRRCSAVRVVVLVVEVMVAIVVIVSAAAAAAAAVDAVILVAGAVVEERLDAAEARGVVDAGVGRTEHLVAAEPLGGQGARRAARLAPAPRTLRTDNRVARVGQRRRPAAISGCRIGTIGTG